MHGSERAGNGDRALTDVDVDKGRLRRLSRRVADQNARQSRFANVARPNNDHLQVRLSTTTNRQQQKGWWAIRKKRAYAWAGRSICKRFFAHRVEHVVKIGVELHRIAARVGRQRVEVAPDVQLAAVPRENADTRRCQLVDAIRCQLASKQLSVPTDQLFIYLHHYFDTCIEKSDNIKKRETSCERQTNDKTPKQHSDRQRNEIQL